MLVSSLRRQGCVLVCDCGRHYPVVNEIPILVSNVGAWAETEGLDALRRPRVAPEVLDLLIPPTSAAARNRSLVTTYKNSPPSPYSRWLGAQIAAERGVVLEAGAGRGHAGTIRLDLNFAMLRSGAKPVPLLDTDRGVAAAPGSAIVADAADPPFLPETFDRVVLSNVLDSCRDPYALLAQCEAVLRPGGALVIGCAYAFSEGITPPEAHFSAEQLVGALEGRARFGPFALDARLCETPQDLRWTLRISPRTRHSHRVQCLVARKPE